MQRMGSISEDNGLGEGDTPASGHGNDNSESPPNERRLASRLSGMEKLKSAIRKASITRAFTQLPGSRKTDETDQNESGPSSQPLSPQVSENPLRKNSSVSLENRFDFNKRRKSSQVSLDLKAQKENGKSEAETSLKSIMKDGKKKSNKTDASDGMVSEDKPMRKRSVSVKLFENFENSTRSRSRGSVPDTPSSKFFNTLMERKFSTAGIGFSYNTLLDNGSNNDFDRTRSTVTGSVSGFNMLSESCMTGSETVFDFNTCTGSLNGSCISRNTSFRNRKGETAERPKTSHSTRKEDEEMNQKGTGKINLPVRSQNARQVKKKTIKPIVKSGNTANLEGRYDICGFFLN